jgi:transposase
MGGLVALSVVEQRYRAVLAVVSGPSITDVAAEVGVSRQTVSAWVARYRERGLGGLSDRSRRPRSRPRQCLGEVEALVWELRRAHPWWGALRILHELQRSGNVPDGELPSRASINRTLHATG